MHGAHSPQSIGMKEFRELRTLAEAVDAPGHLCLGRRVEGGLEEVDPRRGGEPVLDGGGAHGASRKDVTERIDRAAKARALAGRTATTLNFEGAT